MSEEASPSIQEYPFRSASGIPFLLAVPVLLGLALWRDTPHLMRCLAGVVLVLYAIVYLLTFRKFKGVRFGEDSIDVTNGFRVVQRVPLDGIEKVTKDGASFAIDYKDAKKQGRRARLSFLKNKFTEDTWQQLSHRLASIR